MPFLVGAEQGNAFRRPMPQSTDMVAYCKFLLVDEKGRYTQRNSSIQMVLCKEYLWVSEALSIPLAAIRNLGVADRIGVITYFDEIANESRNLRFTNLGFVGLKDEKVVAFLEVIEENLPIASSESSVNHPNADDRKGVIACEYCGSREASVYVFEVFQFFGLILLYYSYRLTPLRYVLCDQHAGKQVVTCSLRTGLLGYLGFPGCFAAPWYVCKNLWKLHRDGVATFKDTVLSVVMGIGVPVSLIAGVIYLLETSIGEP